MAPPSFDAWLQLFSCRRKNQFPILKTWTIFARKNSTRGKNFILPCKGNSVLANGFFQTFFCELAHGEIRCTLVTEELYLRHVTRIGRRQLCLQSSVKESCDVLMGPHGKSPETPRTLGTGIVAQIPRSQLRICSTGAEVFKG